MAKKWLYLPVEIKVREVPAKVLLAGVAASNGYNVVFARKSDLSKYLFAFPKGIILGFGAHKNFEPEYRKLKERGFSVFIMDEEGLATFSDDMYRRLRLSDDTLDQIDAVLTWGSKQSGVFGTTSPHKMPDLYETGNVRFDILRPEFRHLLDQDVKAIRKRFGRFILINSSFGACNHFNGKEQYFKSLKEKKVLQNEGDAAFYRRYFQLKEDVFQAYLASISRVAEEFPDHQIIIRPHPSEDYSAWESAAQGRDNVQIIHEGSVHAWLLACDVVVHHFCTTALEAFVSDVPAIGYRPFKDDDIETPLVYRGSLIAETEDDFINILHQVIGGDLTALEAKRAQERDVLKSYIQNIDGKFAFENTLAAFDKHAPLHEDGISYLKVNLRKFKCGLGEVYRFFKRGMRWNSKSYTDHKFPSLEKSELEGMLDDIGGVAELKALKVQKIDKFCYLMTEA